MMKCDWLKSNSFNGKVDKQRGKKQVVSNTQKGRIKTVEVR